MLSLFLALLLVFSPAYCSLIPPVIFGSTIRDLYPEDSGDMIMMAAEWTVNGSISSTYDVSQCHKAYLGGVGRVASQGSFIRSYTNLPGHNVVDLALNVKIFDIQDFNASNLFGVKIDNAYLKTFNLNTVNNTVNASFYYDCYGSDPDLNISLSLMDIAHSSNTITIEIFWEMDSPDGLTAFAIRDLVLSFQNSNSPGSNNCPGGFYSNNGVCMECDPACENCFGPSSTQCFPCQMGYNLIGNECVQCPSNCSLCSGPNVGQCLLCNGWHTLDFDGTCNPFEDRICKSSPHVIKNNNELMDYGYSLSVCARSCSEGEAMLSDRTCAACDFPLQKVTENGALVCKSPCKYKYLLSNGNCQDHYCSNSARWVSGFLICDLPCNGYLYPDGSCLPTCAAPYAVAEYQSMMTCENLCPYRQYLHPDGSCQNSCPTGYQVKYENTISRGSAALCYFPCDSDEYLYQDGNCSATCGAAFKEQIDSYNNKFCNSCYDTGGFLYDNGTCSNNCPTPFIYLEDRLRFCRFPCASNQYYSNGRCTGSCEAGSTPHIEGSLRFCDSNTINNRNDRPCPSTNMFKYQNGSCLLTCPFPLLSTYRYYYPPNAYCTYPCSPGNYLYPNTSCLPDCGPGYVPRIDGNMSFCEYNCGQVTGISENNFGFCDTNETNPINGVCPQGFFMYNNGSCLSTCLFPLSIVWEDGNAFCKSLCSPDAFLFPNGTCGWICDMFWHIVVEGSIQYCKPPCPDDQFIYNNTCISTCEPPRKQQFIMWNKLNYCDDVPLTDCGIYNTTVHGDGYYQTSCYNPYNDCDRFGFEYEDGSCADACRYPMIPEVRNMSAFCVKDPNYTGPDNTACWPWEYAYPNGSCLSYCSPPYMSSYNYQNNSYYCALPCSPDIYTYDSGNCSSTCDSRFIDIETEDSKYCKFPCDSGQYLFPNDTCSYFCPSGIYEVLHGYSICYPGDQTSCGTFEYNGQIGNNCSNPSTGTVSLQLYIRYNMSLIDFKSQDGLNRFKQKLALVLGVDRSDIIIMDVREGSTIIESQVILTSESDQNSITIGTNKAQEMMKNYISAIGNQQLKIFTGVVLDSRQSVQVSTPSGSISQVLSSEPSSGSAVGIGIGAGLAALFVVVGGYWLYRRYRARKDVRSAKTGADVIRENANQNKNDQEANDSSSVTVKKDHDIELKYQISTLQGLQFDQRDITFEQKMKDTEKIDREKDQQYASRELSAVLNLDHSGINIIS